MQISLVILVTQQLVRTGKNLCNNINMRKINVYFYRILLSFFTLFIFVIGISFLITPQVFAATPTISGAGIVTSYDPWVVWVNGSNLTNPLTVRLYDNNGNSWGNGSGVAYGSGNISFSLPSNMPPSACNYTGSCNISFDLVNTSNQVSSRYTITLPQFSGYSCSRCSNTYGCTYSTFKSTDTGCVNPITSTISYTQNLSCPRLNPPPSGGDNNRCPAPTNTPTPTFTPTPTPQSCSRCSANFGCTRASFQSNDGCVNPLSGTNPTYTTDLSCPKLNPPPAGGDNSRCPLPTNTPTPTPQSCSRCSANFGCSRATFQSNDGCVNPLSGTTPTYTTDPTCPKLNPPPTGGDNNRCAITCNRCSLNFGCTMATFQSDDGCVNPLAGTTPIYTPVADGTGTGECPRLTTIPSGGNNNNCPAENAPTITFTTSANEKSTTVDSGGSLSLKWIVNGSGTITCEATPATDNWSGSKSANCNSAVPCTQTISVPANTSSAPVNYSYYLRCSNTSRNTDVVNVSVRPQSSGTPGDGDPQRPASFEQTSGLIFTGGYNPETSVDLGKFSERSWLIGAGDVSDQSIVQYKSPALPTSYQYLLAAQSQTKNAITKLTCSSGRCQLPTAPGVYQITDSDPNSNLQYTFDYDLNVARSTTYPNGMKIILLVDGDFLLKKSIKVDTSSIFILAARGIITVDESLGQGVSYACNQSAQLEGIYTTNEDFQVKGNHNCSTGRKDQMLSIAGSVVTNSDLSGGGKFINGRDLCENNLLYPAVSIRQRPDFIINLPDFAKSQKLIFKELKP